MKLLVFRLSVGVVKWKKLVGTVGVVWGVIGFGLLLGSAIMRLSGRIFEVDYTRLHPVHILFLIIFTGFMLVTEGYGGFHQRLSPRFASRAKRLLDEPRFFHVLLAPFFCIGYFHASRRRMISSFLLTLMIVLLVVMVSHLSQPWRGLLDFGVVSGLIFGIVSLLITMIQVFFLGVEAADPEFPK